MDQNITVFMLGSTSGEGHLAANRLRMIDLLRVETILEFGQLPPPPWQNLLLIAPWQNLSPQERHEILQALAASPTAALIIIAQQLSSEDARGLMNGGLIAILDTPCSAESLEHHILHAADELRDVRDELDRLHAAESRLSQLTPRERDILRSLATGLSNKGVARELDLSPRTVEVHRANMIRRSGARNIAELIQMQFILDRTPTARTRSLTPVSTKPIAESDNRAEPAEKAELSAEMGPQPFAISTQPSSPAPYPQGPLPPSPYGVSRQSYYRP